MLECLIIGDSIAVGTHQARPECAVQAKVGINSQTWNSVYLSSMPKAKTVVISLGSNDHAGIKTKAQLQRIREKAGVDVRVFWIIPSDHRKPELAAMIKTMAQEYGDTVVPRPQAHISPDGIHPTGRGYKILGEMTK